VSWRCSWQKSMNWGRFQYSSPALWSFRVDTICLGEQAPNLRQACQATFVITMPLIVPLFLGNSVFMQAPNGTITTVLSLFPLSALAAMIACVFWSIINCVFWVRGFILPH
jgi:hypothetical protein